MASPASELPQLINEFGVAKALGVSVSTVRHWRLQKSGPRYIKLGATVRYKPSDLHDWIDSHSAGGEMKVNP